MKARFKEMALYTGLVCGALTILKVQYTGNAYSSKAIDINKIKQKLSDNICIVTK